MNPQGALFGAELLQLVDGEAEADWVEDILAVDSTRQEQIRMGIGGNDT